MVVELFLDLLSQPCRAVYMFAKKTNIPLEIRTISLLEGEHQTVEFGKVNPLRTAPALRDGDFCMGESIPMMEYLAEKYKTADHWFPADLQKRSRVREYLSWQHWGMRMPGSKMFWLKLIAPVVFKINVPEDKMAAALEELNAGLDQIENVFIQDGGFIGGKQISIADLVAIVEIMQPVGAGLDVFESRPKLSAWRDRVVQAVGKELFDEAHKKLLSGFAEKLDCSKMEGFRPRVLKLIG